MIEIERKFLVANDLWRAKAGPATRYRQGYLAKTASATVLVRRGDDEAVLTVKSPRSGLRRDELSYPIPLAEADDMLRRLCGGRVLEKARHLVADQGSTWTVDVYLGPAEGLVVAEIELEREDQPFAIPSWLGAEISHDPRYRNSAIALWRPVAETASRSWNARPSLDPANAELASPPL